MEELFETQNIEPSESVRIVVDNLWNAIRGFVDKYQRQSEQFKVIRDENIRLNYENEQSTKRIEDLERLVLDLRQEEPGNRERVTELEAENLRLNNEIERLIKREQDLLQSTRVADSTLFVASSYESKTETLQKEYESVLDELSRKDLIIDEMRNKILDLENQINDWISRSTRMEETEKINQELKAQIEQLIQEKQENEFPFEQQNQKLLELTRENDELARSIEESKAYVQRNLILEQELEKTTSLLEQKRSEMESIAKEIEVYRASIDELSNQVDLLNAEIQQLKEQNQNLQNEISSLIQKSEEKEQKVSELLQYKREFYRIQSDANSLRQVNKEIKELMSQVADEKVELERKVYRLLKEKADLQEKILEFERQKENLGILLNEKAKEFGIVNSELLNLKVTLRDKEVTKKLLIDKVESLIGKVDKILEIYS